MQMFADPSRQMSRAKQSAAETNSAWSCVAGNAEALQELARRQLKDMLPEDDAAEVLDLIGDIIGICNRNHG
jgi:hypothetical protein